MSEEDLRAELERLKAENQELKTAKKSGQKELTFKVSQKGACSVYGLGRFPVTLYKEQWARLLAKVDDLKEFLAENDSELTSKE